MLACSRSWDKTIKLWSILLEPNTSSIVSSHFYENKSIAISSSNFFSDLEKAGYSVLSYINQDSRFSTLLVQDEDKNK